MIFFGGIYLLEVKYLFLGLHSQCLKRYPNRRFDIYRQEYRNRNAAIAGQAVIKSPTCGRPVMFINATFLMFSPAVINPAMKVREILRYRHIVAGALSSTPSSRRILNLSDKPDVVIIVVS